MHYLESTHLVPNGNITQTKQHDKILRQPNSVGLKRILVALLHYRAVLFSSKATSQQKDCCISLGFAIF